ncbi:MAG: 2-oxoacid:ferredoxin oxidoreductase subunit beta [Pseudomonadota bacterium]
MSFIRKPTVANSRLPKNALGLTRRDYEGGMSTLCAGCGHDSITAALVQAAWELELVPHQVAKLSGIGCSSKTPAYFMSQAHGVNSVHGRMPSVATGAGAANRDLVCLGVSGDGDSLSIGFGQLAHAMRRNLNMAYVIENNGVYGLTKGQFSASADVGSRAKRGETNVQPPIDPVVTAIALGCTFVARSFSGDKQQLVPLLKAAIRHRGFALLDVLSPCVTFNDHEDSTKSYAYTRRYYHPAIHADFVPPAQDIKTAYDHGEAMPVELHDGSRIVLRKVDEGFDPSDRARTIGFLQDAAKRGEVVTGLMYIQPGQDDLHDVNHTVPGPLHSQPYAGLHPGADGLKDLQRRYR